MTPHGKPATVRIETVFEYVSPACLPYVLDKLRLLHGVAFYFEPLPYGSALVHVKPENAGTLWALIAEALRLTNGA